MNDMDTKLYLGEKKHWRLIEESLVTFMTSRDLILQNFNELEKYESEFIEGEADCMKYMKNTHVFLRYLL